MIAFLALQVPFLLLLVVGWATLLAIDLWVVLPPALLISTMACVMTGWQLHMLLRPVEGWREALAAGEERALLAANLALQHTPTTFTIRFAASWVIAYALATAYVWFAMPDIAPIGYEELGAITLLLLATPAGSGSFCFPVVTMLIARERVAVSHAMTARGLQAPGEPISLGSQLIVLMLAYVVASACLIASAGWSNNTAFNRYATTSDLVGVALREAQAVRSGHTPTLGRIVDADALPPVPTSAALDIYPAEFDGLRVVLDRRGHVYVGAPLDDGRWLLVDGPVVSHHRVFESMLLIFGVLLALWGLLTATLNARSLINPLVDLERSMRRLVGVGEIRRYEPLPVLQDDEIGNLTRSYNDMVAQLDVLVVQIRETAVDLSTTSAEIYAATQEQEAASVRNSSGVGEVRNTVASLASSAHDIANMANDVRDNAARTLAMTDVMASKIDGLSVQANGISELLEIIRDVADRSDLLALNGALEATRAGEAGRGFALVAAEMRRLAERVTQSVAGVRTRVADIKGASAATVIATQESRQLAQATAMAAQQIVTVTQEQSEGTTRASKVVDAMTDFVVAASAATSQTRAAAEGLRERVETLDRLTRRFEVDERR